MADSYTYDKGRVVASNIRGARAGESFATTAELNDQKERDAFDREKGWSGIAGAAKRPKAGAYEAQFKAWREAKAAKTGQMKALDAAK